MQGCQRLICLVASTLMIPGLVSCSRSLAGESAASDPSGDAARSINADGKRPPTVPDGVDLVSVQAISRGGSLRFVFEASTDMPLGKTEDAPGGGPTWSVRLWNSATEERPIYSLAAGFSSTPSPDNPRQEAIQVVLCDSKRECTNVLGAAPKISGKRLTFRVPLKALSELAKRIYWAANSYWGPPALTELRGWGDDVPDLPQSGLKDKVPPSSRVLLPSK
jgi:hypothetical protein